VNADAIRAAVEKRESELTPHDVPEWGVRVYLRPLSLRGSMRLEDARGRDASEAVGLIVARSACDESGQRIWSDDDAARLAEMNGDAVATIAGAVRKLNKLVGSAGEIDAEKKDSKPTP
jgi:hypothetical protein